jgi:hypothetical protein
MHDALNAPAYGVGRPDPSGTTAAGTTSSGGTGVGGGAIDAWWILVTRNVWREPGYDKLPCLAKCTAARDWGAMAVQRFDTLGLLWWRIGWSFRDAGKVTAVVGVAMIHRKRIFSQLLPGLSRTQMWRVSRRNDECPPDLLSALVGKAGCGCRSHASRTQTLTYCLFGRSRASSRLAQQLCRDGA